jgi:hypothetical protein
VQSAANTKPHTYEPELNYSKTINVDTLRLALKKGKNLRVNFTFEDIKVNYGNYYRIENSIEQERHVKKLNPKFISLTSDLKDYNKWYFGEDGLTLLSGYFLLQNKVILTMSKLGYECDSHFQRYWLAVIDSNGTISEPLIIHDEHGDFGYYLLDFKMMNDSSIELTAIYDVESNILPDTKIDTTATDILALNITKFPFDTISFKRKFVTTKK